MRVLRSTLEAAPIMGQPFGGSACGEIRARGLAGSDRPRAVVAVAADQPETGGPVHAPGRDQRVVWSTAGSGGSPRPGRNRGTGRSAAPSRCPRAIGSTSRMRSCAVSGSAATQNTQPTRRPSSSAIQAASRAGSRRGGVVGDDARDQGLELAVPAELGGVDLAVRLHHPTQVTRPPQGSDHRLRRGHVAHPRCWNSCFSGRLVRCRPPLQPPRLGSPSCSNGPTAMCSSTAWPSCRCARWPPPSGPAPAC